MVRMVADDSTALAGLLTQVASGDEQAFGDLYDRVAPRLHGLVRRIVIDAAASDEVTQEVFVDIWRSSAAYHPDQGTALAWMFTIAHRRAVDRVRSAAASRQRDAAYSAGQHTAEYDVTAETVDQRLSADRLHRAIERISPLQRDAVRLAYLEGISQTQVAERLGIPLGTAKSRIRDGLLRLRAELGGEL